MSIKAKSIGVRGYSRVKWGRDDSCLAHELSTRVERQRRGYKRQTSVYSADTTPFLKVYLLDVYFSFFVPLIRSTSLLLFLPWRCVVRSMHVDKARTRIQLA